MGVMKGEKYPLAPRWMIRIKGKEGERWRRGLETHLEKGGKEKKKER